MYTPTNFVIVSVIMERLRNYSPERFIDQCFADIDIQDKAHLFNKYVQSGNNVLSFITSLDLDNITKVNVFLNKLIQPHERELYNYSWELLPKY